MNNFFSFAGQFSVKQIYPHMRVFQECKAAAEKNNKRKSINFDIAYARGGFAEKIPRYDLKNDCQNKQVCCGGGDVLKKFAHAFFG